MENLVIACLQMAQDYARKTMERVLTESEAQLYEQCCRLTTVYLRSIENSFRIGMIDQEKELDNKLQEKEDEDGEATSGDKK